MITELDPPMAEELKAFSRYIIYQRRLSEKTREVYSSEAERYLKFLAFRKKDLYSTAPSDIEEYLIFRRDGGASERTEGRILSSLRAFYRFLISEGNREDDNPAKLVEKPKESIHLPRVISVEEVDELLSSFLRMTSYHSVTIHCLSLSTHLE